MFFREGDSLLKVGVALMALALALTVVAVVVSVVLRGEPGRVVAAEAATAKSPHEPSRYFSGEEESPEYGSSPSYGRPVGQQAEEAKEPQAVAAPAGSELAKSSPNPHSATPQALPHQQTPSGTQSEAESQAGTQEAALLPGAQEEEEASWPTPTNQELQNANSPRHYGLLPGAIMSLTIEDIGIYDAPVFNSDGYWALVNGVAHVPETSLPWSETPQRNVYLAGHRMGFRGTWSRMIFYNLNKLEGGDRVLLRDREGRTYEYEVSEIFLADPTASWVMGQVRGRDMLSLQTCTPIPTFEKRLIVRADRV